MLSIRIFYYFFSFFFFFNDTATTEIYTLSLHDALPICESGSGARLDHRPRRRRRVVSGAEPADPGFHSDRGEALPEQGRGFGRGMGVACHHEDRAAPAAAEGGVDPGLPVGLPVEPEVVPAGA